MPLYEYECKNCGFSFEINQKFSEEPIKRCLDENCEGEVCKVITKSAFDLKGDSWARDGYK